MPEPIYAEIGRLIRDRRIALGLSQTGLANALTISRPSLANIEVGRQRVYIHHLFEIAKILRTAPGFLVPRPKIGLRKEIKIRRGFPPCAESKNDSCE